MLRAQAVYTDPAECERRRIPPKLASSYLRATITEKNKRGGEQVSDIKFDEPDSVDYQQARDAAAYCRELSGCFLLLYGKAAADKVIADYKKKVQEMMK